MKSLIPNPGLAALTVFVLLACPPTFADEPAKSAPAAQPIAAPGLPNCFAVGTNFYSGGQPEDDAAFALLARLGVKTIVSVDGAKPDLAAARRHGMRYVHLPLGYDGVPAHRIAELTVAASLPGPVYVHCHHGRHRGPAALAVMGLAAAGWTSQRAEAWLRQAGASAEYAGLHRAVREFRPPDAAALAAVQPLPEVATTSSLVDVMVALDEHFDRLKGAQKAGWKPPPKHPGLAPAHEATLLWEQLRELLRHEDTRQRPDKYRAMLAESEKAADKFRQRLGDAGKDGARVSVDALEAEFKRLGQTCVACHKTYRNE